MKKLIIFLIALFPFIVMAQDVTFPTATKQQGKKLFMDDVKFVKTVKVGTSGVQLDSITKQNNKIKFMVGSTSIDPLIKDTVNLATLAVMIKDTTSNAVGNYTTMYDFKNEYTKSNFDKSWKELGSPILFTPIVSNIAPSSTGFSLNSGVLYFILVKITETIPTLTGFNFSLSTAGNYTAGPYNGIGFYSLSGGTATRIAMSTDVGTLFTATANTLVTSNFSSALTNVTPGYYLAAILYTYTTTQTTQPVIYSYSISPLISKVALTNSWSLGGYLSTQTTIPTTLTMSSTTSNYILPALIGR